MLTMNCIDVIGHVPKQQWKNKIKSKYENDYRHGLTKWIETKTEKISK